MEASRQSYLGLKKNHNVIVKQDNFFQRLNKSKYLLLLAFPTFIYMIVFHLLPIYGLIIAFYDYNAFKGIASSKFVGFEQFRMFFSNMDFANIIRNTFLLGLYRLIWTFPAPILLALLINELQEPRFKKLVQTVSYLPHFVSVSVVAGMTIMFLNPTSGLINEVIKMLGGEPIYFMANPNFFRPIYIITDIWQEAGWGSIIYIAAMTSIDPTQYESAVIDGANKFKQIIHITLPGISQTIIIMLIISTGNIATINFDKAFMLQNPLIMEKADVLSTYVYRAGIRNMNYSFATAAGLFNSLISVFFVYTSNYISRKFGDNSLF